MAIINCTPDSFHAPSRADSAASARQLARQAVQDGADLLDLGAESTRPGSTRVPADEQRRRLLPVIEAIRADTDPALAAIPISVDTTLAEVALAALEAGADAINDVSGATEDPSMLALAAETGAGLCLMHRLAPPDADRYSTDYDAEPSYAPLGVVETVRRHLVARTAEALRVGVAPESILLDPGLGFGKSPAQNIELLRATPALIAPHPELPPPARDHAFPILSATSRKSFVAWAQAQPHADTPENTTPGKLPGPDGRLPASLAFSIMHLALGARVFRVHDVEAQGGALRAAWTLLRSPPPRDPSAPLTRG